MTKAAYSIATILFLAPIVTQALVVEVINVGTTTGRINSVTSAEAIGGDAEVSVFTRNFSDGQGTVTVEVLGVGSLTPQNEVSSSSQPVDIIEAQEPQETTPSPTLLTWVEVVVSSWNKFLGSIASLW